MPDRCMAAWIMMQRSHRRKCAIWPKMTQLPVADSLRAKYSRAKRSRILLRHFVVWLVV